MRRFVVLLVSREVLVLVTSSAQKKKVQLSSSRYLHICLACQVISGAGAVCPSYLHSVSYLQGDLFVYTASTILVNKIVPFSINQNELLFSFWIFT